MFLASLVPSLIYIDICHNAAKEEIIRRYYNTLCDFKQGICKESTVDRSKSIMDKLELTLMDREVAKYANEKAKEKKVSVLAIKLNDGKIITGSTDQTVKIWD